MATPTFSLAYTSVRPNFIPRIASLWRDRAQNKGEVEMVIAVDEADTPSVQAANMAAEAVPNVKVVINRGPRTCVSGWNTAAAETSGKVIIAVADDFLPPPNWDTLLLGLQSGWEDGEHVVHVEDGYVHNIFVLSILTRKRYERYGYVFYPKYLSLFCDTEFGEVALRDGCVIEAPQLLFEHMHPDCHKRTRDDKDAHHASPERWSAGEQLFRFRKSTNFPLDDGPKAEVYTTKEAAPAAKTKSDEFVVYMQLTRNDFCLEEVVTRLFEEGIKTFFWAEPDEYWSGEPIEPLFAPELNEAEQNLKAIHGDKINIVRRRFNVKASRMPGDSRIEVETRIRNDSLDWVRGEGYRHLLIVDGDELWMRGTLELIRRYVDQGHLAVNTQMIPAIGLPSYPVDQATDTAVVYISESQSFKVCRSPHCRPMIVPVPRIIHFTGTRRTLEETVTKHRRGGHYDDPDYDFETWLKDVLPNVKPGWNYTWPNGLKGLHMYKKWQIWPAVRDWRAEEVVELPKTLHKYMGGLAPVTTA